MISKHQLNRYILKPRRKSKKRRARRRNPTKKVSKRRCGRCKRLGHNIQTCTNKKKTKKAARKKIRITKKSLRRCSKCEKTGHNAATCTKKKIRITKKKTTKKKTTRRAAATGQRKPKFHFFTRSGPDPAPFARGGIPSESEKAPVLDRIYEALLNNYGPRGRQVFYAMIRSIRPRNTLMERIMRGLTKIEYAKNRDDTATVRGIVSKFTKAKRALDGLRNAMEDKEWQKAIDYMEKAERAMQ